MAEGDRVELQIQPAEICRGARGVFPAMLKKDQVSNCPFQDVLRGLRDQHTLKPQRYDSHGACCLQAPWSQRFLLI